MPVIVPAAIAVAGGIYKTYQGAKDKKEAKQLASQARPQYQIPQTETDNLNLLTNRAGDGLSGQTKQLYLDNADRGLTTSISAILQGGGNPNDISKLYDNYLGGINNVGLQNEKQHLDNIDNEINARYRQSGYLDKQWNTNVFAPWADNQRKAAQQKALGEGEMAAGINTIASGAMSAFTGGANAADVNSIGKIAGGASGLMGAAGAGAGGGGPVGGAPPSAGGYPYVDITNGLQNVDNPRTAISPDSIGGNGTPFAYGLDVSKMKPNDAMMVQKLLWGQG